MIEKKNKEDFNLSNKKIYKYNIILKSNDPFNPVEILDSINIDNEKIENKIEEFFYYIIKFDRKRYLYKFQFILK